MKWQNYTKGRRYITLVCYPLIPPRIHQMKKKKNLNRTEKFFTFVNPTIRKYSPTKEFSPHMMVYSSGWVEKSISFSWTTISNIIQHINIKIYIYDIVLNLNNT